MKNRLTNVLLAFNAIIMVLVLAVGVVLYQRANTINTKVDEATETVANFKADIISMATLEADKIQANAAEKVNAELDSLKQASLNKIKNYFDSEDDNEEDE